MSSIYGKGWKDAVDHLKGEVEKARKEGAVVGVVVATVGLVVVGSLYKIFGKKD